MKNNILLAMLFVFSLTMTSAQTKAEKKALKLEKAEAAYSNIKALIESGEYEFEASWAIPLGNEISRINFVGNNTFFGNRINLTGSSNYLKMDGKNADLFLPYFGTVHRTTSYSRPGNGLEFKGEFEDLEVNYIDSKRKIDIEFEVNTNREQLRAHLTVGASGTAYLSINSSNRLSIRYNGKIKPLQIKEVASN